MSIFWNSRGMLPSTLKYQIEVYITDKCTKLIGLVNTGFIKVSYSNTIIS